MRIKKFQWESHRSLGTAWEIPIRSHASFFQQTILKNVLTGLPLQAYLVRERSTFTIEVPAKLRYGDAQASVRDSFKTLNAEMGLCKQRES